MMMAKTSLTQTLTAMMRRKRRIQSILVKKKILLPRRGASSVVVVWPSNVQKPKRLSFQRTGQTSTALFPVFQLVNYGKLEWLAVLTAFIVLPSLVSTLVTKELTPFHCPEATKTTWISVTVSLTREKEVALLKAQMAPRISAQLHRAKTRHSPGAIWLSV